jgi:hypothetical protein
MPRIILTFPTMFEVLSAEKILAGTFHCRPTPTPPGLGSSICGMSIELLEPKERELSLKCLKEAGLEPSGVHEIA